MVVKDTVVMDFACFLSLRVSNQKDLNPKKTAIIMTRYIKPFIKKNTKPPTSKYLPYLLFDK